MVGGGGGEGWILVEHGSLRQLIPLINTAIARDQHSLQQASGAASERGEPGEVCIEAVVKLLAEALAEASHGVVTAGLLAGGLG